MKLNLGCGLNKLEGYVNIDIDPEVKPDQVVDFRKGLPFDPETVDQIVMFHTIEHIEKIHWRNIFHLVHKVLKLDGVFYVTFPEFEEVAKRWIENHKGQRDFWEATIYGRQLSDSDYHVALCSRNSIASQLKLIGFEIEYCGPEPVEEFNSLIRAKKIPGISYEDTVNEIVFNADKGYNNSLRPGKP